MTELEFEKEAEPAMSVDDLNGGGTAAAELAVQGMHCQSCASLIEETLVENPAVPRAVVDLAAERAYVTYDPRSVTVDELCATITEVGYSATPVGRDPDS